MKVIIDDKIPYIRQAMEGITHEAVYAPGNEFTPQLVADADALIVRTRTRCNEELLKNSRVKFIATATIGHDHIDADYCRRAGISWTNAPGCNAASVAQYVESCLMLLTLERGMNLKQTTLGIVGVGHVGRQVQQMAQSLGMRVLLNDPPRAEAEGTDAFVTLQEVARESDIITFHTPLTRSGAHQTLRLADETFFAETARKPIIINTSRGEVVHGAALLRALETGRITDAILDVWENEPHVNPQLLQRAFIATPHIAGYSADGKANATRMSVEALARFFGIEVQVNIAPPPPPTPLITAKTMAEALLQTYDPRQDSARLKAEPERFEWLRGHYPLRREKGAYEIVLKQ